MDALDPSICTACHGSGTRGFWRCPECRGMAVGYGVRGKWLFWDYPLTTYHVTLEHARHIVDVIRFCLAILLGGFMWGTAVWILYRSAFFAKILVAPGSFVTLVGTMPANAQFLLWFGVLFFTYAWYRSVVHKQRGGRVEHHAYREEVAVTIQARSARDAWRGPRSGRINIAETFTPEAIHTITNGFRLAAESGARAFGSVHIFRALLGNNRIGNIFLRLGIPASVIAKKLALSAGGVGKGAGAGLLPDAAMYKIFFAAYERAYELHQEYVSVTELLEATIASDAGLMDMLLNLDIEKQKLVNAVEWARIRENLYRRYQEFRHAAAHRSTKGMDKAMTALATPMLNQYSEDVTVAAQFGRTESCVAREEEIEEVFRVVEGGGMHVLLVGEAGVGKRSIVEGIAEHMVVGDVPARLYDKRLVRLSTSALLAGTTPAGAVERLQYLMNEVARARNVILFINNIHELVGVSAGGTTGGSLDVASALAEFMHAGAGLVFATTTNDAFSRNIASSALGSAFAKVEIRELGENQAIQVVESKIGYVEYKHQVFFSYNAVEKAVEFAKRYLHDLTLPGSAQELITETASFVHNKKGVHTLVTADDVAQVVSEKTKIPVANVTADETTKLLNLEQAMHERVVGQDEAVGLVANALRRSRADMRAKNRPIANFLFLGPTGVGKTELAKTIAEVYFGGETRMTRLDMSEYQDKASIYRLIGSPGEKGSGVLTETIRREPFTLVLLDEIEKADKDILNLFLQVMDDGRLTDSTGRVVDFTNAIVIATSNAGTQYVADQLKAGISTDAIKERLLHGELKEYFRPEFLNRFDGIVLFKPLSRDDIKAVASRMLARVGKDLEQKGIVFTVQPSALEFLADKGFDPEFGARPMRRAIEERVENKLAGLLLSGQVKRHSTIVFGEGGELTVV